MLQLFGLLRKKNTDLVIEILMLRHKLCALQRQVPRP
jgi:hypothetical protein